MEFSAQQIADMLNGELVGKPEATVSSLSKIEEGKAGTLSFLANPQYARYIYDTEASVVIVNKDFKPEKPIKATLIKVDDAYGAFAKLLEAYNQMRHNKTGIHPRAWVSEQAKVGQNVFVGAGSSIEAGVEIGENTKIYQNVSLAENVKIGNNCIIFPGVCIYADCVLGDDVTIHSGSIIGCDGFGFAPGNAEGYHKVAQIGNVIIEDQVEIGANVSIDRATLGSTIIRKGVKLDNLIQIAHNVEIGEHTVIAAQTGIAGSTKIGKNCMIGGQVGIIGHLKIGNGVKIAAQSGIGSNLKDGEIVQGSPAFAVGDYKKSYVYFRKLPMLANEIHQLKKNAQ